MKIIGFHDDRPDEDVLRAARLRAAKSNPLWTELEAAPVPRPPAYFVDSGTDAVYQRFPGDVFEVGTAAIALNGTTPLAFYVDGSGDVQFLQRRPGTWSEITARRARRGRVRA